MKILIVTPLYPPDIGGPATHTSFLEKELPKHNVAVSIMSFGTVRHLPKVVRHSVFFGKVLFRSVNADIVYALDPVSVGLPSLCAATLLRKKFIVRIAGDYAWEQGVQRSSITDSLDEFSKKKNGYPLLVIFLKRVQTFVARRADKIIVPSKYLKEILLNWGLSEKRVTVIYSTFENPENLASKEVLRELLGFKGRLLISIGRLVPWKGFTMLIKIMPRLVKKYPDCKLLIIGSGPDEKGLKELVQEYGVERSVIFSGSLEHDIMLRYLKTSDVFVLNTNYEGLSHVILEALSLSVPVLTTRVGGNPEIIQHDENGLLADYNDEKAFIKHITALLSSQVKVRHYTVRGEQTLSKFSKESTLRQLTTLFSQL